MGHLKKFLEWSRKFGVSLNPKKYIFMVTEGKLLGFIILKDDMMIYPEHIEMISKLSFPHNTKVMQFFLGKINFMRRSIPSFSEIVKFLQGMI